MAPDAELRRRAARWPGWVARARKEINAAGGAIPYDRLQEAMVAHYCNVVAGDKVAVLSETAWVSACALASIPDSYLSREDDLVRLPGDKGDSARPAKKPRLTEEANNVFGEEFKAHVGELPFSATETTISLFFEGCGEISKCDLLKTHEGKSRGIAFLSFATQAALDCALVLDGKVFGGRAIKVAKATGSGQREQKGKGKGKDKGKGKGKDKGKDKSKDKGKDKDSEEKGKGKGKKLLHAESREFEVFVGGLPFGTSVECIRKDFTELGETGRFHIPLDEEGGHTGIAFVNYLTPEGMEKALAFDDQDYGGVWIRVQRSEAPRSSGVAR